MDRILNLTLVNWEGQWNWSFIQWYSTNLVGSCRT